MINAILVQDPQRFASLQDEWNLLLESSIVQDAFLTWEWLYTWWDHFGACYQLELLLARTEDGLLVGILPLMSEKHSFLGLRHTMLRNIGFPPPDVGGFIIRVGYDEDVLCAFAAYLTNISQQWDVLHIREIPDHQLEIRPFLETFPPRRYAYRVEVSRHFHIQIKDSWQAYCQSLSKNLRKDLKKKINRIKREGILEFRRHVGSEVTPEDYKTIFQINKSARYPDQYASRVQQDYHLSLLERMGPKGWVDVSFLYIDQIPVAYRYGLCFSDCFEDWRTGFNLEYYKYSIGKISLFYLIRDCFKRHMRGFHFLRGDEEYKTRWQVRELKYIHPWVIKRRPELLFTYIWLPNFKRIIRNLLEDSGQFKKLLAWYDQKRGNR